jgi:Ras-related protein Rab-32
MHYKSTIGVDFALKVIQWTPGTIVRIQLWDIAGQERFGNMTRVYYKEAVGALVVYDVSRFSTFEGVSKWKADLDDKLRLPDGSRIPAVLLANKIDLQDSAAGPPGAMIKNQQGEMDKFCQEKQFMGWFGTSAKEDKNIEDACRFLISKILENDQRLADMQMSMTGGGAGRAGRRSAGGANGGGRLVDLNDGNNTGANGKPSSSKAASGCCV